MKKTIQELTDEQTKLLEGMEVLNVKVSKQKQALESISTQISELKEQQDYGAFKFVHANLPLIIQKIAPKHKTPPDHEITLSSGSDAPIVASIPWTDKECSDENPCNILVCPRCSLIHFKKLLDNLLANYYAK